MRRLAQMLGRLLLAPMFIHGGFQAASEPAHRVQAADRLGLPQPELVVRLNGAAMVVGGVALALGIKPRWAAALLAFCLVPTTYAGHPFWTMEPGRDRTMQEINFLKNTAMLGGLVLVLAPD
jgi:uncharacterized membrane protein YphA (DoxX/SURF4 family)